MTATKAVVKEILAKFSEQKTPKKLRSVKAQKTAAKVQLMKLKMKSSGDKSLPQEERVYFLVSRKDKAMQCKAGWVAHRDLGLG